jgi:SAM-dependent methyltransferase
MRNAEMIDGFACYAPAMAVENDGFSADTFEFLAGIEDKNFWFKNRNRVIRYLVGKFTGTKQPAKFLEIGCGTGFVLKGLQQLGNLQLVGSEIYIEGLKYAKQRLPGVELIQLDATDMPFKEVFDAIGAFDVIEHIQSDTDVIANMYKSVKKGGHVFISVPQYMFMWSDTDDLAYHKRRYTRKELINKVRAAGFTLEYVTSFVFFLFPLMMLSRSLNRKKKKNVENEFSELKADGPVNAILSSFMRIDEFLIKMGISLPWGGSLMIVGKK